MELTKDVWNIIEWICVSLGIIGTIWASTLKGYKIYMPFALWIASGVIGLFLHVFYSKQYGLLLIATISLGLSFMGLLKSISKEKSSHIIQSDDNNQVKDKPSIPFYFGLFCTAIGVLGLVYFSIFDLFSPDWFKSNSFEISATFLNIAGISFISAVSKESKWAWIVWFLSNVMFSIITYKAGFMGLTLQQVLFAILSLWGIINWFFLSKNK